MLKRCINNSITGLHFNKVYTHSGTSCPQCVYLFPSYFVQINIKKCAEIGLMDVILVSPHVHEQIKLCCNLNNLLYKQSISAMLK